MSECEKEEDTRYWQNRAKNEYTYKGEIFYTITPVPYYYARREIIVKNISRIIDKYKINSVCDMGCGDGEYLKKIYKNNKKFYGVDISENMIRLAKMRSRKNNMDVSYETSGNGIHSTNDLDFVYSVALFAHVNDEIMKVIFKNVYDHLTCGGIFCICEQIAPYECKGAGWKRRTFQSYIDVLEEIGFEELEEFKNFRIDFSVHRVVFERHLAKRFYKNYAIRWSSDMETARIECNKNKWFVFCSWLATKLSIAKIKRKKVDGWGYCFILVRRRKPNNKIYVRKENWI